jgi:hypothetical protein
MTVEQLEKDFEQSSKFIQDLSMDYTWIEWGEGSMSISDVPKGWEKIIRNLFGAINQYSKTEIYYLEDTPMKRFKFWWNKNMYKAARFVGKITKPTQRLYPSDKPQMIFPEMQKKIEATIWWKAEYKIQKFFYKLRFNFTKYQRTRYPNPVTIEQTKSKFANLCCYTSGGDDIIKGMIRLAEYQASKTCEVTGNAGVFCVNERGWYRTLSKAKAKELGFLPVKN